MRPHPRSIHRVLALSLLALAPTVVGALAQTAAPAKPEKPAYPVPHVYPLSWELKFEHVKPQRIVVDAGNGKGPQAYWYMTYLVTNQTDREQQWLPTFEMLNDRGDVVQSDGKDIPAQVFDAVKRREKKNLLEPANKIAGVIRVGDAEAREGVAIWAEPNPDMGKFAIFVTGLSGEVRQFKKVDGSLVELKQGADFKDVKDNLVVLRKTLQLNYHVNGDEVYPGEDEVNDNPIAWVMR